MWSVPDVKHVSGAHLRFLVARGGIDHSLGFLTQVLDCRFKRHHKPIVYIAITVVVDTAWKGS
jgi:hypothetical protein